MQTNFFNIPAEDIEVLKRELSDGNPLLAFHVSRDERYHQYKAYAIVQRPEWVAEETLTFELRDEPKTNWYFGYAKTRLMAGVSCGGGLYIDGEVPATMTPEQAEQYLADFVKEAEKPVFYWCFTTSFAYHEYERIPDGMKQQYEQEIAAGTRHGFITDSFVEASRFAND